MAQAYVDDKVKNNKVMVFSKSYCPYCKMAKDALGSTGVKYELVELDERGTVVQCKGCSYKDYCIIIDSSPGHSQPPVLQCATLKTGSGLGTRL